MDADRSSHISCRPGDSGTSALLWMARNRHHLPPGPADEDTIFTNRKVILVLDFDVPLFIVVNERDDSYSAAVEIVGHGIMCRIQKPFPVLEIRKESLHPEISLRETMGIIFRGRAEEREEGEVAFQIGCDNYVQVIPMIEAAPRGIPADITVRLGGILVTVALRDAFGSVAVDAMSPLPGRGDDRSDIPGDGEGRGIDELSGNRSLQEFPMIYSEKGSVWMVIKGKRGRFQLLDSDFINVFCFGSFCSGFLTFFFLTGYTCGERLSEPESQSLRMKS